MDKFKQNEWVNELPADISELLRASCVRRALQDGELLHAVGDEADGMYCVLSGRLRLSSAGANGQEVLVTFYEEGNWLGEVSLLDGRRRSNEVRAIGDTEILLLPKAAFNTLLAEHPELYPHLVQMLCHKIRFAIDQFENALFLPLNVRLAQRLLELVRVYGKTQETGVLIDMHLPQEDLARMVHAARQSVNRDLSRWERQGWISLNYGRITVFNTEALGRIAAGHSQALCPATIFDATR